MAKGMEIYEVDVIGLRFNQSFSIMLALLSPSKKPARNNFKKARDINL
jgi:hypothetical protein